MSTFWSGWIIILTVGNIIACIWLVWWTMRKRKDESASGDVTGHTWDGDLQEYNNPLPRWWLWLFYITLVFGVIYLALYPGLGSFAGVKGWTSGGQYQEETALAAQTYDPIFEKYAAISIEELARGGENEEALAMGKRMYLSYCSQCHGSSATGVIGKYPNLTDNDWLWGGEPARIKESILQGRNAVMPAHAGRIEGEKLDNLVAYVQSLSGMSVDTASAEAGKADYAALGCIGCHGVQGTGNTMLGAPNLTDDIWLYGNSTGVIKHTIRNGRNGVMPAQKEFLGEEKSHIIAAYIYSLSAK